MGVYVHACTFRGVYSRRFSHVGHHQGAFPRKGLPCTSITSATAYGENETSKALREITNFSSLEFSYAVCPSYWNRLPDHNSYVMTTTLNRIPTSSNPPRRGYRLKTIIVVPSETQN